MQCITLAPFSVRLVWDSDSDLDLYVQDASCCTTFYGDPYGTGTCADASLRYLEFDCRGSATEIEGRCQLPQQEYTYVLEPAATDYKVAVNLFDKGTADYPFPFDLYITRDGQEEHVRGQITETTPIATYLPGCRLCQAQFYEGTDPGGLGMGGRG